MRVIHNNTKFKSGLRAVILSACALAVTACASKNDKLLTYSLPDDYRARHPITIEEAPRTVDIPVGVASSRLNRAAKSVVRGFARDYLIAKASTLGVLVPSGGANGFAAQYAGDAIKHELIKSGVPAHAIKVQRYDADGRKSTPPVRLAFLTVRATVEECGSWKRDLANTYQNRQYGNYGCATQSNLAAMVSHPLDFINPRGYTEPDASSAGRILAAYQEGTSPAADDSLGSSDGTASE
jgi:pilus assembly protein CpaD